MWRFVRQTKFSLLPAFFCLGSPEIAHAAPAQNAPFDTRCFPIKTFVLAGVDRLSEVERAELIKPYIGQFLDVPQLNVQVKNTPQKPWRVRLSRHNGGQRSTDEKQFASGFYL